MYARSVAPPPTPADVVGAWLGFSDGRVEFLRLEFDDGGTGYACISYLPGFPARLYRIETWTLKGGSIAISARPIDPEGESIFLRKVAYSYTALQLEFGGKGWKRTATLIRERLFSSRAADVKERIDKHRRSQK